MESTDEGTVYDKLRRVFDEHGWRSADGRSPLEWSDEEVEVVVARIVRALAQFAEAVREVVVPAIRQMTVRIDAAFEPIRTNLAWAAALERSGWNKAKESVSDG